MKLYALLAVLVACVSNPPPQYPQQGYQQPPPGPAPDPNAPPEPPHTTADAKPADDGQGIMPKVPEQLPVDPSQPMPEKTVGVDAKLTEYDQTAFAQIDARADIFSAGMMKPDPARGGVAPTAITLVPGGGYITVGGVRGKTGCDANTPAATADGGTCAGGDTNLTTAGNASGIIDHKHTQFLVGVFIGAKPGTPPKVLDFTDNEEFLTLAPALGQTFFIGDGMRTAGHVLQKFTVPTGAVKLYLGFADGFSFQGAPGWYNDNTGGLAATISQHK